MPKRGDKQERKRRKREQAATARAAESSSGKAPPSDARPTELRRYEPVSDELALAAVDRAVRHDEHGRENVTLGEIAAHLGFVRTGWTTRQLHPRLDALAANGLLSAARRRGSLREWYGERTTCELLEGAAVPDAYGVVQLPGHEPIHLLVELDRGTEPLDRLTAKAAAYARALPRSTLADLNPVVLLLVPTQARAAAAVRAIPTGPLHVAVWSATSTRSPLEIALQAHP